jgi:hypothetical protein
MRGSGILRKLILDKRRALAILGQPDPISRIREAALGMIHHRRNRQDADLRI